MKGGVKSTPSFRCYPGCGDQTVPPRDRGTPLHIAFDSLGDSLAQDDIGRRALASLRMTREEGTDADPGRELLA